MYVDFGNTQLKTTSPDNFGHYWNNVTEAQPTGLQSLVSDDGLPTGISLTLGGPVAFNPWGVLEPGGASQPNGAVLGGLAVASATRDWLIVSSNQTLTVTIGNLPLDGVYKLLLFGSRDNFESRVTEYCVSGSTFSTKLLQTSGAGIGIDPQVNANRSAMSVFENLVPRPDRSIVIAVKRNAGEFAYLSAMRLEVVNYVNFPPTALSVQTAGSGRVNSPLLGRYNFSDREGDPEGSSSYFWERASSTTSPPVVVAEPDVGTTTYLPTSADLGSFIRFGVIPQALSGCSEGSRFYSKWVGPIVGVGTFTSFHIGSSYTQWANMPLQLKNLMASRGAPPITGWQVTSGQNSRYHWENGLNGTIGAGTYSRNELASGSWDAVILQPFNSEWQPAQFNQALDYAGRFYSLADSHGAQFYLYAAWPSRSQSLVTQTAINASFESMRGTICQMGNRPALIIPAGEAFRAVIEEAANGYLKSFNNDHSLDRENLYLDDLHQTNLGAYISALTHYATIRQQTPVGLPASAVDAYYFNDNPVAFNPQLATRIQEIVWWVVANYPHSGVVEQVAKPVDPNNSGGIIGQLPINYVPPPPNVVHPEGTDTPALLRFAFGPSLDGVTLPLENLPHLTIGSTPQQMEIEYVINPAAEAAMVTFTPEWSVDLINWTQVPPPLTQTTRNGQKVQVSWPVTLRREFFRVYVEQPGL